MKDDDEYRFETYAVYMKKLMCVIGIFLYAFAIFVLSQPKLLKAQRFNRYLDIEAMHIINANFKNYFLNFLGT